MGAAGPSRGETLAVASGKPILKREKCQVPVWQMNAVAMECRIRSFSSLRTQGLLDGLVRTYFVSVR